MRLLRARAPMWTAFIALPFASACHISDLDEPLGLDEERAYAPRPGVRDPADWHAGEFHVVTPLGIHSNRLALAWYEELTVGREVEIWDGTGAGALGRRQYAIVAGFGQVRIGASSTVGSVYAFGPAGLALSDEATVAGYVKASRIAPHHAWIRGGTLERADTSVEDFRWNVEFDTEGAADVTVTASAGRQKLLPGSYRNVTVNNGATAVLRSGHYHFESLHLEQAASLDFENVKGPIYVWVRSALDLAGQLNEYYLSTNVLFGYAGTAPPKIGTSMMGTLIAPRATVTVPAMNRPHRGAFHAHRLVIADRAELRFSPFVAQPPPADAATDCAACVVEARKLEGRCCGEFRRASAVQVDATRACVELCTSNAGQASSGCAADCGADPAELGIQARALTECERQIFLRYAKCEIAASLRPETCLRLGHEHYSRFSCR